MSDYLLPEFVPGPAPEPPPVPGWFTAGSQTPRGHIANVAAGRHPLGFQMRVGIDVGARCGNCVYIKTAKWAKAYLKCGMVAHQTRGPGTEIRRQWHACCRWVPDMGAAPRGDPTLDALVDRATPGEGHAVLFDYMAEHGLTFLPKPRPRPREPRPKCQHPGCKRVYRVSVSGGGLPGVDHWCREHAPGFFEARGGAHVVHVQNHTDREFPFSYTVTENEE